MATRFSLEDLIAHSAWARALAAHLVREPAAADDLAQDAWIAGATRPRPDNVPARAWMTGILRNLARMGARSEARRRQREHEVGTASFIGDVPTTPDRLLANVELQRVLAEMLTALREPLRSTVLLRYYEGKSSAQIAREQGIPEGTVRRRLKDGLGELRAMLAQRYGAERWALVVGPLADTARRPSPAVAAGQGMAPLTKVIVAAAVAGLAVGSAVLVTRSSSQPRRPRIAAERAADRATSPTGPIVNVEDPQGKETAVKMNRLRTAVQAIALAAGTASADGKSTPSAPVPEVRGALDTEVVDRVIADHINEVKWCFDQALAKNPQLRGRISVQFTIAGTGAVSDSKVGSSTIESVPLETCVARCPRRWQFPKPKDGHAVVVTYPFEFPLR